MSKTAVDQPSTDQSEIGAFVEHARSCGMEYGAIRHLLLSAGWKEKEIATVFAAETLQMPIPLAHGKGGAREAFYHLSAFTCLYVAASMNGSMRAAVCRPRMRWLQTVGFDCESRNRG